MGNQTYEVADVGSASRVPSRPPAPNGCDRLAEIKRQLQAIERLPAGWDSHGADPPEAATIQSARNFIEAIAIAAGNLAKPHVNPTPSGGAQFHCESNQRYFEIELVAPRMAHFYFTDHELQTECEGEFRLGDSLEQAASKALRNLFKLI